MCGEQSKSGLNIKHGIGSPPRVRGTAFPTSHGSPLMGITPACAGNRFRLRLHGTRGQDHPRVCGEQQHKYHTTSCGWGSPPRVRGTVVPVFVAGGVDGITPACAGNSHPLLTRCCLLWDHPRVCGEQVDWGYYPDPWVGSPPRVRGTAELYDRQLNVTRITPACAGNSDTPFPWPHGSPDHPRVCGEQMFRVDATRVIAGSPPRVRGTVSNSQNRSKLWRITPACAGNRLKKARHFYILFCQIKRIHLV